MPWTYEKIVNRPYTMCTRACGLGSQCRPNECIFESGKPRGVGISVRGHMGQVREMGSQFTSNPGKRLMDPVTARRVPSKWRGSNKGSKGEQRGTKGARGIVMYIQSISSRVYDGMLVVIE
jgi:hypothetical protein